MEYTHRKNIDALIDAFVNLVDMTALWPYLIQNGIYNHDDCNIPEWSKDFTNPIIIREIFTTIKTRGPEAYNNLILSLRSSGHKSIAEILNSMK